MVGWNQKSLWTGLTVLNIILIGKKCQRRGKLSLLELKLREAASTWWKHYQNDREMRGKGKFRNWSKMKDRQKAQFLPQGYEQTLYQRVQNLRQYDKPVKEYTEEFHQLT